MRSTLNWAVPAAALLLAGCGSESSEADIGASASANPCAAGATGAAVDVAAIRQGERTLNAHGNTASQLVAMGEELWRDRSLSGAGSTSCATCHTGNGTAMMNAGFWKPYPHEVRMAMERAGLAEVNAAEMVQLCMSIPMSADPLDYESVELAALTAFVTELHATTSPPAGANPCAAGANPCAAGVNPCAAGMNPCAAAGKNPCGGS